MTETTKTKKFTMSQSTALVYGGAALLIFVVGVRSIFLTSDELSTLSYITLGAVVIETLLLFFYAYMIYNRKDDESDSEDDHTFQLDMSSMENKIDELNQSIQGLNDKIMNIENLDTEIKIDSLEFENTTSLLVKSMDTLGKDINSLGDTTHQFQRSFSELTESINAQNEKIDKLISKQINEEIRSEITSLLQKSLNNEN